MRSSPLSPQVHSIVGRLLLAIYIALPQMPAGVLSHDSTLHARVFEVVQRMSVEMGTGTSSVMSKSLGLIIGTSYQGTSSAVSSRFTLPDATLTSSAGCSQGC